MQIYLVSTSLPTLVIVTLSILTGVRTRAHGGFVIYFLAVCRPAFEKGLCKTFARFLICVLAIDFFIYITHLYVQVLETQNGRHSHSVKYFLSSQVLMIYLFIELTKLDIVFYVLSS